jgi:hypothetical protein
VVDHVSTQSVTASTLPDGTQIAVDQLASGELVQYVKLLDGADNSAVSASVGGDGSLKVDNSSHTQPVSGTVSVSNLPGTQAVSGPLTDTQLRASSVPVSAASLPLPSGASTGAKQDTGNTSVGSIDTKTPALGQALAAASVPVVLTVIQQTALTPPAAITGFALEAGHLAAIDTSTAKIPAQGQALAAASVPVVLTAIQQTALTPPAAITGFALDASITTLDTDLKAEIGTVGTVPGAYTVLDRLAQNGRKLDALAGSVATEATLKKLLAALSKPVQPAYSTLLHR